jgi:hypothetical protein
VALRSAVATRPRSFNIAFCAGCYLLPPATPPAVLLLIAFYLLPIDLRNVSRAHQGAQQERIAMKTTRTPPPERTFIATLPADGCKLVFFNEGKVGPPEPILGFLVFDEKLFDGLSFFNVLPATAQEVIDGERYAILQSDGSVVDSMDRFETLDDFKRDIEAKWNANPAPPKTAAAT